MLHHTVTAGDILGALARAYYGDSGLYTLIVAANDIRDPDRLSIGQQLVIPDAATDGFKDMPHFQYTGGLALGECRELFASGLQSVWGRVV